MKTTSHSLHYIFRIACAMCFIGHGAFGIITKAVWCNYFGVFGIGPDTAYQLMPVVGVMDITFGIILLTYPLRIAAGWLVVWGLFTALLRPLSGESFGEFFERAGNYGAPLILLFVSHAGAFTPRGWLQKLEPREIDDEQHWRTITIGLQLIAFALLAGHGWLNLIGKAGLLKQYEALGFSDPLQVAHRVGLVEVGGAALLLVKPFRQVVLLVFVWKMASELFYPSYELWEWVERGGSYGVLLGLWLVLRERNYTILNFFTAAPLASAK
ncbi:hypothetical protein [Chryseolinea soli]|nr:hypothetical protein [Chryseolinea soli]